MKFIKTIFVVLTVLTANAFAGSSTPNSAEDNWDWTRSFLLNDGTILTKGKESIESTDPLTYPKTLELEIDTTNGKTSLNILQTEKEFTETLIRNGLLSAVIHGTWEKITAALTSSLVHERYYFKTGSGDFLVKDLNLGITIGCYFFNGHLVFPNGCKFKGETIEEHVTLSANQTEKAFISNLNKLRVFSEETDKKLKDKSNWSRTFMAKNYMTFTHSPQSIRYSGSLVNHIDMEIDMIKSPYGRPENTAIALKNPLYLHHMQTEAEFEQALIKTSAYDPILDAARKWTGSFDTKADIKITHDEYRIDLTKMSKNRSRRCGYFLKDRYEIIYKGEFFDFPLKAMLILSVFQTKDQFKAALRVAGLID